MEGTEFDNTAWSEGTWSEVGAESEGSDESKPVHRLGGGKNNSRYFAPNLSASIKMSVNMNRLIGMVVGSKSVVAWDLCSDGHLWLSSSLLE